MTYDEFKNSLSFDAPLADFNELQLALWYIGKNNWEEAHNIAQQYEGQADFDRLHAYLHRAEGDEWNANYWYRRCGAIMPDKTLAEEFEMLLQLWI